MKCPACNHIWAEVPRSGQQNRAYFKLVVERLAHECNTTKEAMHKALAMEFLGVDRIKMPDGFVRWVPKSTTALSTKEFMSYVEKIQRYAADNGFDIPNPNED